MEMSEKPNSDKRYWTKDEDAKLIDALVDMTNDGKFNAGRGFKPGHFLHVEKLLAVSLPDSGLKANPHIASRIKSLKKHFNVVHKMMTGPNCSGFMMMSMEWLRQRNQYGMLIVRAIKMQRSSRTLHSLTTKSYVQFLGKIAPVDMNKRLLVMLLICRNLSISFPFREAFITRCNSTRRFKR